MRSRGMCSGRIRRQTKLHLGMTQRHRRLNAARAFELVRVVVFQHVGNQSHRTLMQLEGVAAGAAQGLAPLGRGVLSFLDQRARHPIVQGLQRVDRGLAQHSEQLGAVLGGKRHQAGFVFAQGSIAVGGPGAVLQGQAQVAHQRGFLGMSRDNARQVAGQLNRHVLGQESLVKRGSTHVSSAFFDFLDDCHCISKIS